MFGSEDLGIVRFLLDFWVRLRNHIWKVQVAGAFMGQHAGRSFSLLWLLDA